MTHWPDIPYTRWQATGASLHMWTQIVGKLRLALSPWLNHSWHATFYVNARGVTTGLIPGADCGHEVVFDFLDHRLDVRSTNGKRSGFALESMSVAEFHRRFLEALLPHCGLVDMHGAPNEVPDPVPFAQQTEPGEYDPQAAEDYWRALAAITPVFERFRSGFLGKVSPVHLFWGSLDLAVTRFSGRGAPLHPGGFPALPDSVTREAYSHEVSSAGFWAGGGGIDEPAFYSYAYPSPDGFGSVAVKPDAAYYFEPLGEFVLPYEAVRSAPDPSARLLEFLQSTYAAAADLAGWDRETLECPLGAPRVPRSLGF
ncbi:MAG: DUF5996 family protein [Pseudomonadota bacterium]